MKGKRLQASTRGCAWDFELAVGRTGWKGSSVCEIRGRPSQRQGYKGRRRWLFGRRGKGATVRGNLTFVLLVPGCNLREVIGNHSQSRMASTGEGSSTAKKDSASAQYDHLFKIVLIGDAGVGKSSILLRFTDDRFDDEHLSTIGVDLRVKMVDVGSGTNKKRVKVTVWDTAGQERFRTLTASYFHKVQGLILVYDVTKRETFDSLNMWNREIDVNTDGAPVVRVLVGNKIDDAEHRQVARREGEAWAQEHSMLFIEASAKTRAGIQQVFMECIMQILDNSVLVQSSMSGGGTVLAAKGASKSGEAQHEPTDEASSSCC